MALDCLRNVFFLRTTFLRVVVFLAVEVFFFLAGILLKDLIFFFESLIKMPIDTRFYNWCFTSFTAECPEFNENKMQYMIFQLEITPKTEKCHWQGYVEFIDKYSFASVKRFLGKTTHIEVRGSTQAQNVAYCSKLDTRVEGRQPCIYGVPKRQGNRSDLDAMYDLAEQHGTCREMLTIFRGNGLRHIHCYEKAALAFLDELPSDKLIREKRALMAPEIGSQFAVRAPRREDGFAAAAASAVGIVDDVDDEECEEEYEEEESDEDSGSEIGAEMIFQMEKSSEK